MWTLLKQQVCGLKLKHVLLLYGLSIKILCSNQSLPKKLTILLFLYVRGVMSVVKKKSYKGYLRFKLKPIVCV